MLTEGWDANTVTHILGVRDFGTQLLCDQVVGRALRRQSYEPDADGLFPVEYADILGIPYGDPAAWFHQRSTSNPRYAFDAAAGRYIILCFFGSAGDEPGREAINAVLTNRRCFDDKRACFFGVSIDPADEAQSHVQESMPGIRYFGDFDTALSRLYGAVPKEHKLGDPISLRRLRRFWIVLDPTLSVLKAFPLAEHTALFAYLDQLPPPASFAGFEVQAPILVLPNVFEPELCRHLISLYEAHGGEESGFMREVDNKTVNARS